MSDIVERTLAALPRLLSSSLLGNKQNDTSRQRTPSRAFQTLLQAVDRAQCRSEEEGIIHRELKVLKQKLDQPGGSVGQLREVLPRIIFCSILGYDVSFSLIHAVKLAQQGKGNDKRAGYIAATLLLDPGHELAILTVGTLLRDLSSSNVLDNCLALAAGAHLVSTETIPVVLPAVLGRLRHNRELVREKAIHCLHAFYLRAPSLLHQSLPSLYALIRDKDPGVLSALVSLFATIVQEDATAVQPFGLALLGILQQVREQRFHACHNYHGVPLPWLQIKLLKILGVLGLTSRSLVSTMVPTLSSILHSVNPKELISLAVAYQCLQTIAELAGENHSLKRSKADDKFSRNAQSQGAKEISDASVLYSSAAGHDLAGSRERQESPLEIETNPGNAKQSVSEKRCVGDFKTERTESLQPLLQQASQCITRFLQSGNHNLRYIGMKSLARLVAISAELAADHQMMVVRCLDDLDPAIRHQTLTLLHHMANPANMQVICSKLLEHLHRHDLDRTLHQDVVEMVCSIAQRLSAEGRQYIGTVLPILSLGLENHITSYAAENMLEYLLALSRGNGWPSFSQYLFQLLLTVVQEPDSNASLIQLVFKILRFLHLNHDLSDKGALLEACTRIMHTPNYLVEIKEEVILCVQHLLLGGVLDGDAVLDWIRKTEEKSNNSYPRRFRQTWKELAALASLQPDQQQSLSFSLTGLPQFRQNMDFTLTFADAYVCEVLESGQPLLKLHHTGRLTEEVNDDLCSAGQERRVSDASSLSATSSGHGIQNGDLSSSSNADPSSSSLLSGFSDLKSIPGYKLVWSKQGILTSETDCSPATQSSLAAGGGKPHSRGLLAVGEKAQKQREVAEREADLAKALFEGITPSSHARCSDPSFAGVHAKEGRATTQTKDGAEEDWAATVSYLPKAASGSWKMLHDSFTHNQVSKNRDVQSFMQGLEPYLTSEHNSNMAASNTLNLNKFPCATEDESLNTVPSDVPKTCDQISQSDLTAYETGGMMGADLAGGPDDSDADLLPYLQTECCQNEQARSHSNARFKSGDAKVDGDTLLGGHASSKEQAFQEETALQPDFLKTELATSTIQRSLYADYLACETEDLSVGDSQQVHNRSDDKVSLYSECFD